MTITADKIAVEKSTYPITPTLTDEAGNILTSGDVTSSTWTLTDRQGNVINQRSQVAFTVGQTVVLSGNDLAIGSN